MMYVCDIAPVWVQIEFLCQKYVGLGAVLFREQLIVGLRFGLIVFRKV